MNFLRFLIVAGLLGYGYNWWNGRVTAEDMAKSTSSTGFVSVAMPDGARSNTVIIFAPQNCSSDAAQRADDLAQRLTQLGIPNERGNSYSKNIANPTPEQNASIQRTVTVLNGQIPVVFINGMAKANPSFDEVVFEFSRGKS